MRTPYVARSTHFFAIQKNRSRRSDCRSECLARDAPPRMDLYSNYAQRVLLESLRALKESAQGPFADWGIVQPHFQGQLEDLLELCGKDPDVVGFKTIICFRTGLNVSLAPPLTEHWAEFAERWVGQNISKLRLEQKEFNDWVVCLTMKIAAKYQKPGTLTELIIVVTLFT